MGKIKLIAYCKRNVALQLMQKNVHTSPELYISVVTFYKKKIIPSVCTSFSPVTYQMWLRQALISKKTAQKVNLDVLNAILTEPAEIFALEVRRILHQFSKKIQFFQL